MKKLIVLLLSSVTVFAQSTTYYPGGTINPPYQFELQSTATQPWMNQVPIPLASELSALPNVFNWGVKCDGVTDDTAALNVALAQSSYKALVLPTGACIISGTLYTQEGTVLQGFGGTSIIPTGSGYSVFNIKGRFAFLNNFVVACLTCTTLTAFEVNPAGMSVQDGLVISNVRLLGFGPTNQWANGLLIHSGVSGACAGLGGLSNDCTSTGVDIQSDLWRYCGACITLGDATGTIPVINTHITDTLLEQSTTPLTLNLAQNLDMKGPTFIGTTGTSIVISASSGNLNNVFLNPGFISPSGTYDITVGAGATNNIFLGAVLNHSRITDAGTNTSYIGPLELTTGASSVSNGHIQSVGPTPTVTSCGSGPSMATGSTDTAGTINTGSGGSQTTCTVTWGNPYIVAPPNCVFSLLTSGPGNNVYTIGESNLVITNSISLGSTKIQYACFGK